MADYDVFLCHCWKDKAALADPLKRALDAAGLRVWYDQVEVKLGDSFIAKINQGIQQSRAGIVLFTPAFFSSDSGVRWGEFETFMTAQLASGQTSLLPIVAGLSAEEYRRRLPLLSPRHYEIVNLSTKTGRPSARELERVAVLIAEVVEEQTSIKIVGRSDLGGNVGGLGKRLGSANTAIEVLGNDCKAVAESSSAYLRRAMKERGVKVRLSCVDPTEDSAIDHLVRIDERFPTREAFKRSMEAVEGEMRTMRSDFPNLFEFRYLPIAPAIGLFIIDRGMQKESIKVEIYTPAPWLPDDTRPHLLSPPGRWRQHFLGSWDNYWAMSEER